MSKPATGPMGLVAGNGRFPVEFARAVRAGGRAVVAVAHRGETDPELEQAVDSLVWVKVGQLGHTIDALKAAGAREAVMLGGITKTSFFEGARPDLRGLKVIAGVAIRSDDNLLRAIAAEFSREGIEIVSSLPWLGALRAPAGVLGKKQPDDEQRADVRYGYDLAKNLGRFDVGQTVVVKDRAPLALEAIEGTDACIARGGALAKGGGVVVVKVVKPGQDERFDLPAAGPRTVEACVAAKAAVLAVEAGGTLLMDRAEMTRLADKAGLVLMGVGAGQEG